MVLKNELNERLANFVRLDVHSILKSAELKKEYVELHLLIEGYKPSCTGCSAKSKLASWKKKLSKGNKVEIKKKIMSNTFKLKKNHPRLSIPFTSGVITEASKDETVWFYLKQAKTEEERKRRESFFDVLPEEKKPKRKMKKVQPKSEEE